MKILVIIIVALMIISGVAFGVMKSMQLGPFAIVTEEAVKQKIGKSTPIYISLDPLTINVISGNKIITTLMVVVQLDIRGDDNAEFVRANLPKISDYLFQDMHTFLPRVISRKNKSLDVFLLRKRLKLATDRLYPKGQIYNVLIQSIDVIQ